jgi:hypothetical protein
MSMRLLLALSTGVALTLGLLAQAYEPGPTLNLTSMQAEYAKGNYPMAQYIGCQLLKQEPSNIAIRYLLGNCYVKFNQIDKAIAQYKYCAQVGHGSQIGTYASTALDQISASKGQPQAPSEKGDGSPPSAVGTDSAATASGAGAPSKETDAKPPDKMDLQALEYKERILKKGTELIAANKAKLAKQIEAIQTETEQAVGEMPDTIRGLGGRFEPNPEYFTNKDRLINAAAAHIKLLQEQNEAAEQKITADCKAQADGIVSQKSNLSAQSQGGHGDVRLVQKGTSLFVRNYVNYHGEVPPPPSPPELKATSLKLAPDPPKKTKAAP